MIKNIQSGTYKLIRTSKGDKILYLGAKPYLWRFTVKDGHSLEITHRLHTEDYILSVGNYRLYSVKNEGMFSDRLHLELLVGSGKWQGYLLPDGLPTKKDQKNSLRSTTETISNTSYNQALA